MVHGSQGLPPDRYDQEVGFWGRSERAVLPDEHAAEVHNLRRGRDRHAHLWTPMADRCSKTSSAVAMS